MAPTHNTMIGYTANLPTTDPDAFEARTADIPNPAPGELLVRVEAVSVNPVDVKQRAGSPANGFRVLGYDAAGVVEAVGDDVSAFAPGDEVYYAGSIGRPGSNQRFQLVEARLVGHKPSSVSFGEAASLPLTAITAWEAVFDRLEIAPDARGDLLVVGASGGVGSVLLQLVRARAPHVRLIATAGAANADWVRSMGAHEVVDHKDDLAAQVLGLAPGGVDWVFTSHSHAQEELYARFVRPFGKVVAIDDGPRDVAPLKGKSIGWLWELMFTDPLHLPTSQHQHWILDQVAALVDAGTVHPTVTDDLGPLSPDSLRRAHAAVESGRTVGKIVLSGWDEELLA
ncbi:zinc-binding alcohol dehydrogenase family protein [Herbiconiux moechotypicola]|uniref:Zinc-type alcohol dehydrogenase-like protein n=1 Tax=Herbiconiux moechotypicola TaxID=637393 RepID=A0ABN3DHL9_9MICO|nr:zinc-binding alcohol dehydrogenase family protein [Herbiconiux moechotypicola]MCS5729666.1 zinc-binding alcohol dehydrogenase family protein [Herbiconiux moechotypicola]